MSVVAAMPTVPTTQETQRMMAISDTLKLFSDLD